MHLFSTKLLDYYLSVVSHFNIKENIFIQIVQYFMDVVELSKPDILPQSHSIISPSTLNQRNQKHCKNLTYCFNCVFPFSNTAHNVYTGFHVNITLYIQSWSQTASDLSGQFNVILPLLFVINENKQFSNATLFQMKTKTVVS